MADAFILPSLSEAHPWSMLEAMACGLPVIASNVGGIPECMTDDRFLVNPYKVSDIKNKMKSLMDMDEVERQTLGRKNREAILNSFRIGDHVTKLSNIYKSALA